MAAFWINDAGTWRKAVNVWINDAGTWRQAKSIWINDAGTWRNVFSQAVYTAISGSESGTFSDSLYVSTKLLINTDGTWQTSISGSSSAPVVTTRGSWVTPSSPTSGNTRWVKVTVTGDPLASGTVGSIVSLASNQIWDLHSIYTGGTPTLSTLTVVIYEDAAGTKTVSTGTVVLTSTNTI
jgi:hypothetical protein